MFILFDGMVSVWLVTDRHTELTSWIHPATAFPK